jgi:hypothetical protein
VSSQAGLGESHSLDFTHVGDFGEGLFFFATFLGIFFATAFLVTFLVVTLLLHFLCIAQVLEPGTASFLH